MTAVVRERGEKLHEKGEKLNGMERESGWF